MNLCKRDAGCLMKNRFSLVAVFLSVLLTHSGAFATALDDYVARPEPSYGWRQDASLSYSSVGIDVTAYRLELTSQEWRSPSEVDRTLWKHWVMVFVPTPGYKDTALLEISGTNNTDTAPTLDPSDLSNIVRAQYASLTGSILVVLGQVPNQPLQFSDETFGRSQDRIIAYSWDKFLDGGDNYWPVQLPMVKSVVACMDTIQTFQSGVEHFVVVGASKDGWAAWLTAAVDSRVNAIAPIVSDLLNLKRSFAHHWACYGFWSSALTPYEGMGIFDRWPTQRAQELVEIVDPYFYLDRPSLHVPKYITTSAGDEFFVLDSAQFYMDEVQGETHLRTVPNTDHGLTDKEMDVLSSLLVVYDSLLTNQTRPQYSWVLENDGSTTITVSETPKQVNLWQADSPDFRDFRYVSTGPAWTSTPLTPQSPGVYVADPGIPATGWRAYFVELVYDYSTSSPDIGDSDYYFTTEVRVLPEIRPFEADGNLDRRTNLDDLLILAAQWLLPNSYYDIMPRRKGDGIVNLQDMSVLALHWLESSLTSPHIVAHWPLNSNPTDVSSPYGNDGVVYGNPSWVPGKYGSAIALDGVDDYVQVPGYKGITGTASRTCTAWIKTSVKDSTHGAILSWGKSVPAGGDYWYMLVNYTTLGTPGALHLSVSGGNVVGTTDLRDGQWHHVAVVLNDDGSPDTSEILLYVDGQPEALSYMTSRSINTVSESDVYIGSRFGGTSNLFTGLIDDVRIYDTPLTQAEISEAMQNQ